MGDFKRRDARRAVSDFPDIKPIATPPARGNQVLDIIMSSFNNQLVDSGVTAPIEDLDGVQTDHKTVHAQFRILPHNGRRPKNLPEVDRKE